MILLVAMLVNRAVMRFLGRSADRRRLHQLQVITRIAALATAGLIVVLKDFIVAFFGWMSHNGIRLGDWVDITGVGGEVIEIGVLRTVLLEMGNWTDTGHPTRRRVAFMNNFAIEGHFFNFSTTGQWLWDELQVTLAGVEQPYEIAK